MPELPDKVYFRIGEVAGLVGVEPHVLRYWEREFRSIRPQKSTKGQRIYSRKDVENLLRVRDLLYRDGFTIAGAKKRMKRPGVDVVAIAQPIAATEELEAPAPESTTQSLEGTVRDKLVALRTEVEAFLGELETHDEHVQTRRRG